MVEDSNIKASIKTAKEHDGPTPDFQVQAEVPYYRHADCSGTLHANILCLIISVICVLKFYSIPVLKDHMKN
jgi:hypothetical protein